MRAIFHKPFSFSSRKSNAGWAIKASTAPQSWPREVVEAAIAAGCATKTPKNTAKSGEPHSALGQGCDADQSALKEPDYGESNN